MRVMGVDPGLTRCGLSVIESGRGRQVIALDVDVVAQLSRLKQAGADSLFLVGNVGPSSQVVKSLDRMGWSPPIVSHWGPAGGRFTDIDGADSISLRSSLATNGALHDDFLTLLTSPTSTGQTR